MSSKDRLDINITTTFIELALTTLSTWASDREHMLKNDRTGDAPYRIRNRTGCSVLIWHDQDSTARRPHEQSVQLANEETVDWRFDDLRTMREVYRLVYMNEMVLTHGLSVYQLAGTISLASNSRGSPGSL